jgi:hypothetical protein
MRNVDFVVEAVTENEEVKKSIFQQLDKLTPVHAILASNTSSISITKLGAVTNKPHRVIGMHFMNPVPVMALVEVARGVHTSQATFDATKGLAEFLGKSVCTSQDRPGFLVNRVLIPMINEAFFCLMEVCCCGLGLMAVGFRVLLYRGVLHATQLTTNTKPTYKQSNKPTKKGVGTAEDIDKGMRLGTNQPMGPLRLADFIGARFAWGALLALVWLPWLPARYSCSALPSIKRPPPPPKPSTKQRPRHVPVHHARLAPRPRRLQVPPLPLTAAVRRRRVAGAEGGARHLPI